MGTWTFCSDLLTSGVKCCASSLASFGWTLVLLIDIKTNACLWKRSCQLPPVHGPLYSPSAVYECLLLFWKVSSLIQDSFHWRALQYYFYFIQTSAVNGQFQKVLAVLGWRRQQNNMKKSEQCRNEEVLFQPTGKRGPVLIYSHGRRREESVSAGNLGDENESCFFFLPLSSI